VHIPEKSEVERASGKLSRSVAGRLLNVSWFENLGDPRRKIAAWRKEYNEARSPSTVGYYARHLLPWRGSALRATPAEATPPQEMRMSHDPPCRFGGQTTRMMGFADIFNCTDGAPGHSVESNEAGRRKHHLGSGAARAESQCARSDHAGIANE